MGFLFGIFSSLLHLSSMSGMHTHMHNQKNFYGHIGQIVVQRSKLRQIYQPCTEVTFFMPQCIPSKLKGLILYLKTNIRKTMFLHCPGVSGEPQTTQ